MQESILKTAIRSFLKGFGYIAGLLVGIMLLVLFVAIIVKEDDDTVKIENKIVILPNADGKREELKKKTPLILQIPIEGEIGLRDLTAEDIRQQLIESREGDLKKGRVKGILLTVNSPGGEATNSDAIYRHILHYKEKYKVPVYAYVDGICASGGYYIAVSADKIYASPSSLIGSVGVLLAHKFLNLHEFLKSHGVQGVEFSSGKDKNALSPLRPWTEEEKEIYQHLTDGLYKRFIDVVTLNRPMLPREKLVNQYGAKVFMTDEAAERGFIDVADAEYEQALSDLAKKLDIEKNYQVIQLLDKNWLKKLIRNSDVCFKGMWEHRIRLNGDLDPELEGKPLLLWRP